MKHKSGLLLFICSILFSYGFAKTHNTLDKNKKISIEQWEVHDVVFHSKLKIEKPFNKKMFAKVVAKGKTQNIPLFYNGNNTWILRYSSSEIGKKTYNISGDVKDLNGKNGVFIVTKNTKKNRHGGIVLNETRPDKFFYEDGTHYFNLAFECDWLFALDYAKDDLKKTKHLLNLLDKNGYNQVVMNVYTYDVSWQKDPLLKEHPEHEYGGRDDVFPFLGSNTNPDFSALNVAFFNHFDKVIGEMHNKEIVSHLMIYVWNKLVNWPDMNTEADNLYFDYVVKRYQAYPNVVWDVSKEALFYGRATKEYISNRIERIREADAFNRLVTVHDYGFCKSNSDEVDFISAQNWTHPLYRFMLDVKKKFPKKPIFNIEHGGYEESPYKVFPGDYTNAEACLRRNYMCLFAGAYTTHYWQGTSWNVVIHNPFEQPEDFYKPKFDYFKHMNSLFKKLPFENFQPNPSMNSSGYNLLNKKDGMMLFYVPKENHVVSIKGNITKHFNWEKATKQWFNTLTGEFSEVRNYEKKRSDFYPWQPWRGEVDAILIIRGLESVD
ncbi:DUF4038 domain-containing protein [uncultured Algibacter sp.]|uniref:apiosidase-like domain-containing protein n=1 Tax=uncultured Algibacter sp. TaxID=298659 RepID=UPI003216811B